MIRPIYLSDPYYNYGGSWLLKASIPISYLSVFSLKRTQRSPLKRSLLNLILVFPIEAASKGGRPSCSASGTGLVEEGWLMLRCLSRENSAVGRSLSTCVNPPLPWLFVGLGNPGDKFKGTRHNVGFEMIDALADSLGISLNNVHCKALFAQGFIGNVPIFLAKPQTYMNLCGESTGPLAAYYKLPLNRVMVFHDDKELPCGVLRLQHNGGHSSHNGLKSVIDHFRGNRDFARLRIGIGRPPGQMDPKAFLLQKFNSLARERIDAALKEGVDVLKLMPSEGFTECARWFNSEQKYKYIRPHTTFKLESMDNHLAP